MNSFFNFTRSMQEIFNYFDLQIGLDNFHFKPFEFVCTFGETKSSAQIVFENKLFKEIIISPISSHSPLDEDDSIAVKKILEQNLHTAISKWIDFHLYKVMVETQVLTKRI